MTEAGRPWTLVVLAGGLGSRYGGAKQIEPLGPGGAALADYSLWDAWRAGARSAVIVSRPDLQDAVEAHFSRWRPRLEVTVVTQRLDDLPSGATLPAGRTRPWGTVHAVLTAAPHLRETCVVVNADDLYGRVAIDLAGHFASRVDPAAAEGGAIGYRLRDTLSPHGPVARALLRAGSGGVLTGIEEITGLARDGDGVSGARGGTTLRLTGDEPVSMNIWVLSPTTVAILREMFADFLGDQGDSLDAECPLPDALGGLIATGRVRITLLGTAGGWLGVTHAADRPRAETALRALVAAGAYPPDLFGA